MRLTAADGHEFDAYLADTSAKAKSALVVIQEIFGVNSHIRSVADGYANNGFWAIAPALFDRVMRHVELGYGPDDRKRGMNLATQVGLNTALKDVEAALTCAAHKFGAEKVGVVGYCWGGTLAWLAATRLTPGATVGYYGGQIAKYAGEKPRCPVMLAKKTSTSRSQRSKQFASTILPCRSICMMPGTASTATSERATTPLPQRWLKSEPLNSCGKT